MNLKLLNLIERVLGKGKATSKGNYAFHCPKCKHRKPKLEINLDENSLNFQKYNCWVCKDFEGFKIKTLFQKLEVSNEIKSELKFILPKNKIILSKEQPEEKIFLPKEFKSLSNFNPKDIFDKRAINYLYRRGINNYDIIRYNIGYCNHGIYSDRIIIPSYNENGELNYFIARSFEANPIQNYKNPKVSRDIIFNELFINWDIPIILTEGVFDALTIKRNVIPLLGKTISNSLMKKLVTSKVKKIYISLDKDAMKDAIRHAEELIKKGKEVYLIETDDKDASQLGFEKFTKIIQNTKPLTFLDLMTKKIELC